MEINHSEWQKESSLTSPLDRDRENKWRPEQNAPPLTVEETETAMKELNITSFTDKFPRVDKTYADPVIPSQYIGLISFVPSKGAKPDDQGVYGFAKLRGNFATEIEASQRAEFLIRNVDSYHKIYHTYIGRPFPITISSDYSATTEEVDIRKKTTETISQDIKAKREDDQREMREIQQREENLLKESKQEEIDPYENYITLRVKKAQLQFTYLEHQKKMAEVKETLIKTRKDVEEMDEEYPEFKDKYYDKYMQARKDAGFVDDPEKMKENFLRFLVEDAELDF